VKAVIVSDSHGRFGGIQDIIEREAPFDMFLHAGDIQGGVGRIEEWAGCPVYVVKGNCDWMMSPLIINGNTMEFDDEEVARYMGSHSGRDGDKDAALGLHVADTEHGAPYYLEAREVYECEVIYRDPLNPRGFEEIPRKRYENFPAGIHSVYIGKIVSARRR
jgi:hypothetical protein